MIAVLHLNRGLRFLLSAREQNKEALSRQAIALEAIINAVQRQPRVHDEAHLEFVRSLPCVACGNNISTEACHIRHSDLRVAKRQVGIGEKPSDVWTVPMCGQCHRRQHEMGNERAFWQQVGIDPILIALALYAVSGDHERGCEIVANARFPCS